MSELLNMLDFTAKQAQTMSSEQSVTEAPMVIDGITLIPISKVSCGFSFGGSNITGKKEQTTAGAGAKVSKDPLRVIAISGGKIKILNVDENKAKKSGFLEAVKPLLSIFKKDKSAKEEPSNPEPSESSPETATK